MVTAVVIQMLFEALFFISTLVILWIFVGYPSFIAILSRFAKNRHLHYSNGCNYSVSVIVAAHNEEKVIAKKIENLLDVDYPKELLEIIVVDDGSTDRTSEIISEYTKYGILHLKQPWRGKPSAINNGLKYASGEIVLITDANSFFEKDVVSKLARHFSDRKVGAVGGRYEPRVCESNIGFGDLLYEKIEAFLKKSEGLVDSIIGVNGNIAAFRRDLLQNIRLREDSVVEDFELTLCVREMGYRVMYEPEARSWKLAPKNVKDEILQKRRRCVGTIQSLMWHKNMLFNPRYGLFGMFILPSHKLLPMLLPFFIITLCLSLTLVYILSSKVVWQYLFYMMSFLLVYSCIATLIAHLKPNIKNIALTLPTYFIAIQTSIALAWIDYLRRKFSVTWIKAESTREIGKA